MIMHRALPRALLVGDNRATPNWGGRAAGIALVDLLKEVFAVTETVEGREFRLESAGYGLVHTLLPARFDHLALHAWLHRSNHKVFEWYARLERAAGARDFVTDNPQQSVDLLRQHRTRVPELEHLWSLVDHSDVLIVNGEGDFVFTTPPRREVLFMMALMELGFQRGKPVFFVNAMLADCPSTGRNEATVGHLTSLLRRCARVTVRDPESMSFVRQHMSGVSASLVPDALFAWHPRAAALSRSLSDDGDLILPHPTRSASIGKLDFSRPYIVVGGTAAASGNHQLATERYCRLVIALASLNHAVYLTQNDGPDAFLEEVAERTGAGFVPLHTPIFAAAGVLARARLFVSGRYHPAIMASLGGTPSIFLGSTAHKMASLQQLLGYEHPRTFGAFPTDEEIAAIVELSRDYLRAGNPMRSQVEAAAALRASETRQLPKILSASDFAASSQGASLRPELIV